MSAASVELGLVRHPDTPCASVRRMEVCVIREPEILTLYFEAHGSLEGVLMPPQKTPARADQLWKRTCFEVFIQRPDGGYLEFNFSPSSEWAAYEFESYRNGMRDADMFPPRIDYGLERDRLLLRGELDFSASPDLIAAPVLVMALTAVIEETSGAKSYWALAHPPGKPDFHHADGFVLELAAQ